MCSQDMKRRKQRKSASPPEGARDLLKATRAGDVDKVLQLLQEKEVNVDVRDDLHPNKVSCYFITNHL